MFNFIKDKDRAERVRAPNLADCKDNADAVTEQNVNICPPMQYAELQCASHFSFLRGASGCDELFAQAAVSGLKALAVTDVNSVAGMVRAHEAAKATGIRLIIGCRIQLTDETAILVYPTDRGAYSRLCRLLTIGKSRAGKGACHLDWSDLADHADGLIAVLVTDRADALCRRRLSALSGIFGVDAYCALTLRRRPRDRSRRCAMPQTSLRSVRHLRS